MSDFQKTLLHDGGHAGLALAVSFLMYAYLDVAAYPSFFVGCVGVGVIVEIVMQGWIRETRLFGDWDRWRDIATYQLPWAAYFPLVGNWDGAAAFLFAYVPAMIAFYHRFYQESGKAVEEDE